MGNANFFHETIITKCIYMYTIIGKTKSFNKNTEKKRTIKTDITLYNWLIAIQLIN